MCKHCQNISLNEICDVCSDESRDHSIICVVQDPQSALAIEKVKEESKLDNIKVIATGGLGRIISEETKKIDVYDQFLTLEGLRLIYEKNHR